MEGVEQQILLGLLARRDVGHRSGKARGLAMGIAHRHAADGNPAIIALGMAHAQFLLEMRGTAFEMGVDGGTHDVDIVAVHAVEPIAGQAGQAIGTHTEHLLPAAGGIECVADQVPIPQPVIGAARSQGVAFLALAQIGFRPPAVALLGDGAQGELRSG